MASHATCVAIAFGIVSVLPLPAAAQNKTDSASPSALTTDYPSNRTGILIRSTEWTTLPNEAPAKVRLKHSLGPTFTYGIAPAAAVSEYEGLHAQVQIESGQPVICICHVISVPGNPALVRLHPKKDLRELDAGNLHIGGKIAAAEKNDLLPVNVSQPESMVCLIQPQQLLPPGEYALMLGTQNMSIFPFTVVAASPSSSAPDKH